MRITELLEGNDPKLAALELAFKHLKQQLELAHEDNEPASFIAELQQDADDASDALDDYKKSAGILDEALDPIDRSTPEYAQRYKDKYETPPTKHHKVNTRGRAGGEKYIYDLATARKELNEIRELLKALSISPRSQEEYDEIDRLTREKAELEREIFKTGATYA